MNDQLKYLNLAGEALAAGGAGRVMEIPVLAFPGRLMQHHCASTCEGLVACREAC